MDLTDAVARAALERRIDLAAAELCGMDPAASAEVRHQQNLCMIATGNAARARLAIIAARRQVKLDVKLAGL